MRGSPIRKSSDQRSVDSSPRLIAASYVLHRLLVPRHPPCALNNLTHHNTPHQPPDQPKPATMTVRHLRCALQDARVHCAVLKERTTTHPHPPPTPDPLTGTQLVWRASEPRTQDSQPNPGNPEQVRSLRTQQRAYATPPPPSAFPPTPPKGHQAVLAASSAGATNWSVFHPRAPPHTHAPTP